MKPQTEEEVKSMQNIPYQNAVGSLMYAMIGTRPDIAYSVGVVSRFASNPGSTHWTTVKRVIRYLKGTADYCVTYGPSKVGLIGYCDADWAGNLDDRKSTTGYLFLLAGGAISWASKKQPTVALSTTEAEYMALNAASQEAIWLKRLLKELKYDIEQPTTIRVDNTGCIELAKNPTHHARTKHIDIKHHFIRECIDKGEIKLEYCSTKDMTADIMTKALSKNLHQNGVTNMGIKSVHQLPSGSIGENVN
jgi:hypothetical protein